MSFLALASQLRAVGRQLSTTASSSSPLRVCVVGSGPAGFYTAHQLIKRHADCHVDILERLPVPFGLVRFGVAPDHPEVKNCINQFTTLAESGNCRFIGNISVGNDVTLDQLHPFYHAVVMAYGAEGDKTLGIPGEDLPGVYSARAFVGWYNGLPQHKELNPDLSGEVAVVIGQGNVALDVARILLTPTQMLEGTDICDHALRALRESRVRQVHLIGRRGPLQVAFTIKELREMIRLPECRVHSDPTHFEAIQDVLPELPRPRKRLTELMMKTAEANSDTEERGGGGAGSISSKLQHYRTECHLNFLRSPVQIEAAQSTGRVASLKLELNKLEGDWKSGKAIGTGQHEDLACSMVLRSIGYSTVPLPGIPFDKKMGTIPNTAGRVSQGLYCSGWVKTGPVGVILDTMSNSFETAETIIQDYKEGRLTAPSEAIPDIMSMLASSPGVVPTSFSDWKSIEEEERARVKGDKPREKIVSVEEMMDIIKAGREKNRT